MLHVEARHRLDEDRERAVHGCSPAEVAATLATDLTGGLAEGEAAARLATVGRNELRRELRPPYVRIAIHQLRDPLVALLVAAAAVSFSIGETIEATAIALIVVLNGIFGFVQEVGAARAVLALSVAIAAEAEVVRSGVAKRVPVAELVPGDLVRLREGERVPADLRLSRAEGLECDESLLTGESVPVAKQVEPVTPATPLAERYSMAYAGTAVTRGAGVGLVVATGQRTEQGTVAQLARRATPPPTPLQLRLAALARRLALLGVGLTVALATAMSLRDAPAHEAFLVGVSVAVAAVPEGLAATVTIALALGARELARRGAVVRQLAAIETVGEATIVCADKTGTLTENRLRVERLEAAPGIPRGELVQAIADLAGAELDPVDQALAVAAAEAEVERRPVLATVPFDAANRRAGVIVAESPGALGLVKGAPETVLALCREPAPELGATAAEWASGGLRVLLVAARPLPAEAPDAALLDESLEPLGLLALADPLRPEAREAVADARGLGLQVRMLTGDHPATAAAIAAQLGLGENETFARCTPADKLALVDQLIASDEVVAVTGDGINDAPALRRAHVGIAMGHGGTQAAREASSIVLTDDSFATIVAAVREGRRIATNIRSFLAFLLSANFGEVVLFAIAVVAGLGAPLTVVQVLVVNLLTDGPPAVALARERGPLGETDARTRSALLGRPLVVALTAVGLVVGLASLGSFLAVRDLRPGAAQTAAFVTIAVAELLVVYSCRSLERPPWRLPPNRYLDLAVATSALVVFAGLYLPALHEPLGTVSLTATELATALAFAAVPAVVAETLRRLARPSRAAARLAS
ncbi:MAG: cation-transporting P-type ATPase [Gaiellales bacterium]